MPRVFVPKERRPAESRVAATPETVKRLVKAGLEVTVETGAGVASHLSDEAYREAGATIGSDPAVLWTEADLVLKVAPLGAPPELFESEADSIRDGAVLIGLLAPHANLESVRVLAERRVTALSMELIPRITRAQGMDALSSQASIAGYKAVLVAANRLDKYFPLLMTAAGTVSPARVVIMGAGVAGLQAIATARRLGAVVEVSDIREAAREQVQSLGARFIELPMEETGEGQGGYARQMSEDFLRRQREIVQQHVAAADIVITTAQVPGKPAPRLVTREMIEAMRPGAVIVDLATESGGNCELSRAGEDVVHRGVAILGPLNLAATMPRDASSLYSRNVLALVLHLLKDGRPVIDEADEIVGPTLLTHAGRVIHGPTAERIQEAIA